MLDAIDHVADVDAVGGGGVVVAVDAVDAELGVAAGALATGGLSVNVSFR